MSSPTAPILSNAPRSFNGALEFYWYPPSSPGDSAISSYTIGCTVPTTVGPFSYPVGTKQALVSGLSNGVLYDFTIYATNANSNSGPVANFRPFEPGQYKPTPVTTATATKVGSNDMLISWSGATSNDATIYWYVLKSVSSDPADPIIKRTANGLTETSLLVSGFNPASAYSMNVQAVNCPGYSVALSTNTINFGGLVAGSAFMAGSYIPYSFIPSPQIYLSPGSNDYSLEGFVYYNDTTDVFLNIFNGNSFVGITDDGYGMTYFGFMNSAQLYVGGPLTLNYGWASSPILTNQWNHIAVSRSNMSTNIWLNGTASSNGAQYDGTDSIRFDTFFANSFESPGYITNVRFLNGLTAYDPQCNSITVPTAFLSNIPGTQVLLQMTDSNILSNYGTYQSTVTFFDQMTWSSNTPYAGCGSINGSNNRAILAPFPGAKASTFDFSYEAFYYFENTDPYQPIGHIYNGLLGASWDGTITSGAFTVTDYTNTYSFDLSLPTSNTWYHVALARSSLDMTVWVNGTRTTTGVVTLSNDQTFGDINERIDVFSMPSDAYQYGTNGRYVVGNTAYDPQSASITVPTAPLTAISGTQLLLLFSTPTTLTVDSSGVQSNIPNGFSYSSNTPFP